MKMGVTFAIWSNLPKSSFSICTSSPGEQSLASLVKPTMSAYRMLQEEPTNDTIINKYEERHKVPYHFSSRVTWLWITLVFVDLALNSLECSIVLQPFYQNQWNVGGHRGNILLQKKPLCCEWGNIHIIIRVFPAWRHFWGPLKGKLAAPKLWMITENKDINLNPFKLCLITIEQKKWNLFSW